MVAGDTKIGLAGVVVLLALFVVAQTVGFGFGQVTGFASYPVVYNVEISGEAVLWGDQGDRVPVTGECTSPVCEEAFVSVTMEVTGMPALNDRLHYLLYLAHGPAGASDFLLIGELRPLEAQTEGLGGHALDVNHSAVDGQAYRQLQIRLTADTDPTGVPGHLLYSKDVGPFEEATPAPVDLADSTLVRVANLGWRCCAGQDGQDDIVVLAITNPAPKSGLTRCAWIVHGDGVPFETIQEGSYKASEPVFIGSFSAVGCTQGDDEWTWPRESLYGEDVILVTIEHGEDAPPERPQGFPLIHVRLHQTV